MSKIAFIHGSALGFLAAGLVAIGVNPVVIERSHRVDNDLDPQPAKPERVKVAQTAPQPDPTSPAIEAAAERRARKNAKRARERRQ